MTNLDPTVTAYEGSGSNTVRSASLMTGLREWWFGASRPEGARTPMPLSKRLFDITVSLLLLAILWPILVTTVLVLLIAEGRPIFYLGERMCSPDRSFLQIKFRTMRVGADKLGGVTGGDKAGSISPLHRILRRTRADELPQLINVLKGDMTLVGPRPPMRSYVLDYPEIYGKVLQSRPGITGLATLRFHQHEEWLLGQCRTHRETEAVYRRRCIPRKARLDLIYQRRRTLWLDIALVAQTASKPFWRTKSSADFPLKQPVPKIEAAPMAAARAVPVAPQPAE